MCERIHTYVYSHTYLSAVGLLNESLDAFRERLVVSFVDAVYLRLLLQIDK